MEFQVDQARFLAALNLAQTVTDRRSTMPVLANVLLSAKGEQIICSATDTTIALTEHIPAEISDEGSLTIGVRHLLGIVKALPAGPVQVKGLDNHRAQIVSGRSEFQLMGLPDTDFPKLPDLGDLEAKDVDPEHFSTLIQRTLFSVSTDEARVNLNGALLESDGETSTMVSTDGHRLTKYSSTAVGPGLIEEQRFIIPRKGLTEIKRVLDRSSGSCKVAANSEHLFVCTDELTLSIKLSAVNFPPYSQVIPKGFDRVAIVPRSEFVHALRRAEILAPEKTATVRIRLGENVLELTADNPDLGVAKQEIEVDYGGDELVAGFNARYLLDALDAINSEYARLEFQGELDPCVLRPDRGKDDKNDASDDFLAVVMPMRI